MAVQIRTQGKLKERENVLTLYIRTDVIAERRERSEANNRVLFEIPRYLYIYIYICLSARALHKTVYTLHKS